MNKVLNIYKPIGLTPLQTVSKLREQFSEYKNVKIGYAGRLDPMAHGVLLLMIGEATKKREEYLDLDKEYVFEALFGIETDTYDLLGLVKNKKTADFKKQDLEKKLKQYCEEYPKIVDQLYPPYSSKTVNGKPLFQYSRENKLDEIILPTKKVKIYELDFISSDVIGNTTLLSQIKNRIKLVSGDFRQDVILKRWIEVLTKSNTDKYMSAKFKVSCSSGTYVRSLVHEMGTKFGSGAVALDIFRTKAGSFDIADSVRILNK